MRNIEFDENDAIKKILLTFWKLGFSGTSLSDLQASTGLSKGSLYNSFQSKETMLQNALNMYIENVSSIMKECLQASQSTPKNLENLLQTIIIKATQQPRGCFLLLSAMEQNHLSVHTRKIIDNAFENRRLRFVEFLKASKFSQAEYAANSLCVFIDGLLSMARRGRSQTELNKDIAFFLNHFFLSAKDR